MWFPRIFISTLSSTNMQKRSFLVHRGTRSVIKGPRLRNGSGRLWFGFTSTLSEDEQITSLNNNGGYCHRNRCLFVFFLYWFFWMKMILIYYIFVNFILKPRPVYFLFSIFSNYQYFPCPGGIRVLQSQYVWMKWNWGIVPFSTWKKSFKKKDAF